ncbi:ABC transporter permease [Alteromonas lipolytica]|uniref:Peptide ABC transporter permease n=1 Tax=Alteromonas lipolytica TaxID=1856405 RepID=A0A1E8FA37_9ALTE|nr:FtsX-like permease family protein [Alteromonas lipolytica]OFI32780.1 peptide ABC transporter permease [Alteromonas lipolytica]GGF73069.1 peptide ABC transporter permease [Alteromonas lipolytica]
MLMSFALSSLRSRGKSVALTFLALLISISVLLSVEHVQRQAQASFNRTISDVDLIVGAPSGQLNLLLYSVFRMGSPTNSIRYASYEMLLTEPQVKWAIPLSLGDAHHGFRVLGTNQQYFAHYKYGNKQPLTFAQGKSFSNMFDAVVGADVASELNYKVGDKIVIAHGLGAVSFKQHDDSPFTVTGILAPTGTPVDKTVHVSLQGIEAMHAPHARHEAEQEAHEHANAKVNKPDSVTAILVGLNSKFATFTLQRELNNYDQDRLMAVLPGVALNEMWQMMSGVENLLRFISVLIMLSSLFGLSTMLLASMHQRQQEIAVLRIMGAGAGTIFRLILLEAVLLASAASLASVALVSGFFAVARGWLASHYGMFISANLLNLHTGLVIGAVLLATLLCSLLPAIDAYRGALNQRL